MNSVTNRLLAFAGIVLAAALLFAAATFAFALPRNASPASAQEDTQVAKSTITVRGTGTISAKPDTLKINAGVTVQEGTVKAAQDGATQVANAMIERIKAAGIDEKDYRTSQYNVEPVMDFSGEKPGVSQTPSLVGFRVINIFEITVRDAARAPELLDALVSAGANTVYGVNYSFADADALAEQAYDQAVKDAEAKATRLAGLANLKLGKILSISDSLANVPGPMFKDGMGGGGGAFVPGQQTVQTDVIVTYETTEVK